MLVSQDVDLNRLGMRTCGKNHGQYMDFVNRSWNPGPGVGDLSTVAHALSALQQSLKTWDREVFGSVSEAGQGLEGGVGGREE